MSQFTTRLDKSTEEELQKIMKQTRDSTKNGCITGLINGYNKIQAELHRKEKELNDLREKYSELYSLMMEKERLEEKTINWYVKNLRSKK